MRWKDWGMASNGRCLTARISASLNPDAAYSLWDILMDDVPEKYFLSPKQAAQLLPRSGTAHKETGCTIPQE